MDAAEYRHVVLGLVFLKYISEVFQELYDSLAADDGSDPEDRDEYMAKNVFWVPKTEKFLLAHAGREGDLSIYGQESNNTT